MSEIEAGERIPLQLLRAKIRALRESAADPLENAAYEEFEGRSGDVLGADHPTVTTAMISNAVRILARALTAADFALVRDIITSKLVIDDPNLARILESVFTSFECAAREPRRS